VPEAAAHKLQDVVDDITGYKRRTRWWRWGTALVAVAAVLLYVRVHQSQIDNCVAGNQTKVQQAQLWDTLFDLAAKGSTGPPSAQTQKLTAEFLGDVKATYAPVDCAARYPFW
jgi:hypothetical protein